jgi:type VI secretion system protein
MMILTITNQRAPGLRTPVMLESGQLTIGRASDNDWILPDPGKTISRHHCVIEEHHGQYRLLDISNNGVFIGGVNRSVGQGNSYVLCQDDLILIGDYTIAVAFEPASPVEIADPLPTLVRPERGCAPVNALADQPSAPEDGQQASPPERSSDPTCPVPVEGDMNLAIREVLIGAGLDPDAVIIRDPAETLRLLGETLRIVVAGVVDLLKARAAVKCEFGVEQTQIQAVKNNPLKFSLNVEDTLKMLLGGARQGYLETGAAFEETFADLRIHQMAVLAGTQEAWHDLFKRFDPQALEQRIGEDRGLQGLLGSRKVRCWDAFTLLYQTLLEDAEDNRESLLVRKFAKAYGEQMARNGRRAS